MAPIGAYQAYAGAYNSNLGLPAGSSNPFSVGGVTGPAGPAVPNSRIQADNGSIPVSNWNGTPQLSRDETVFASGFGGVNECRNLGLC